MTLSILVLEPYAAPSHLNFLEGLRSASRHEYELCTLPARAWKWRMRTASLLFAQRLAEGPSFDLVLASDYVNLAELIALLPRGRRDLKAVLYFHENQLTYPLQDGETRDHHFTLVHVHAMLAAERVLFNSEFHRSTFRAALASYLRHAPDVNATALLANIDARTSVLPLGTELARGHVPPPPSGDPVLVWNHRWEYDKGPDRLARAVHALDRIDPRFRLALLGQRFRQRPRELDELIRVFGDRVVAVGWEESRAAYLERLAAGHVFVSTARHEFFGLATLEALRTGLLPVLPADLAYPELLPPSEHARFLYRTEAELVPALARALATVRSGAERAARERLLAWTDRFAWSQLAGRFDAVFEAVAQGDDPVLPS